MTPAFACGENRGKSGQRSRFNMKQNSGRASASRSIGVSKHSLTIGIRNQSNYWSFERMKAMLETSMVRVSVNLGVFTILLPTVFLATSMPGQSAPTGMVFSSGGVIVNHDSTTGSRAIFADDLIETPKGALHGSRPSARSLILVLKPC